MDARMAVLGFVAGFLNGLLSVNFLISSGLISFFRYKIPAASRISLVSTAPFVAIGLLSTYALSGGNFEYLTVAYVSLGGIAGAFLGTKFAGTIRHAHLVRLLSVILFVGGLRMADLFPAFDTGIRFAAADPLPAMVLGLFAGILSGIFGIGGGIILVPALTLFFELGVHRAIATSMLSVLPIVLFGLFFHIRDGPADKTAALRSIIPPGIAGSVIGVLVSVSLDASVLKQIFGVLVILFSLKLFLQEK